jgi:hypothetical protein
MTLPTQCDPKARELLASWMIAHGFATGHGETVEELLSELEWQVKELRNELDVLSSALSRECDRL